MSKSAELDSSRINLLDDPATIVKKVKGARTDAFDGLEWDNSERPEARNLLAIYQLATGMSMVRLEAPVNGFACRVDGDRPQYEHRLVWDGLGKDRGD